MDKLWMKLAWMLPKPVAKWAYIRVWAHATSIHGDKSIDQISYQDAMRAWRA